MDLQALPAVLAHEDTIAVIPLRGPDGQPDYAADGTRATISLVGLYSPRRQAAEAAWQAAHQTAETEPTREAVKIAIASWSVVDWHGIEDGGTPVPCTPATVIDVLTRARWLFDQVYAALDQRERFFDVASTD